MAAHRMVPAAIAALTTTAYGRMSPLSVGVATMVAAVPVWLPTVDYDDATAYDAPNPYDAGPGSITATGG